MQGKFLLAAVFRRLLSVQPLTILSLTLIDPRLVAEKSTTPV